MIVLDFLVHVYNFILNPNKWGFRRFFPNREGSSAGGPPIPVSLCLGNEYFKPFDKQGYGRELLVWLQDRRCRGGRGAGVVTLALCHDTLLFCKDNPDHLAFFWVDLDVV